VTLAKRITVLLCLLVTVGCASSVVISKAVKPGKVNHGVMYAIPKQLLKFTLDRKQVTQADLAKAAKEAKDTEKIANTTAKTLKEGKIADLESAIKKKGDPEAIGKKKLELEIEKLNLLVLQDKVIKATAKRVVAEKNLANHTGDGFKDTISITALDPIADANLRFVAQVENGAFSSETIELKTTPTGLLSGGSGLVKGQADEIFVALARAISSAKVHSASRDAIKSLNLILAPVAGGADPCHQVETKFEYRFDVRVDPRLVTLNKRLKEHELCTQVILATELGDKIVVYPDSAVEFHGGLLYPRKIQLAFNVQQKVLKTGPWADKDTLYAEVIDNNTLGLISLPKSYFADNEFEFEFKSGLLTKYKSVTPNEFLQALSMIPEGLKALIAIPAEIIQLKIDYSTKETDYNQARMAAILSQRQFESITADETIFESDYVE
jgi:hypothetical protein